MFGGMYLIAVLLGLLVGLHIHTGKRRKRNTTKLTMDLGMFSISIGPMIILLVIVLFMDMTYGYYVGSLRNILWLIFFALLLGVAHRYMVFDKFSEKPLRVGLAIILVVFLLLSSAGKYLVPDNLEKNDLYDSLNNNEVKDENQNYINDTQEIRVIPWNIATDYLQRVYGDAGSYLSTDGDSLMQFTDPSYVDGRFVWVNAPMYEFIKWTGGKDVPFFVYIDNDPVNMSSGNIEGVTHKVEVELDTHVSRISWGDRIYQLLYNRYAGSYEVAQVRIDMDDDHNPWWIVYLAKRDTVYSVLHLKKILMVNAMDIDDVNEYDLDDDIPEWLEVVYPDEYVYNWVSFWGSYRKGVWYKWFDKSHLYDPDDTSARFIVVDGTTYWQIPMVQKESSVLGGYVWVNTRTGEATFYNREQKSLVDKDTVQKQVEKYLASGALGFQKLDIHEGYLYPFMMNDGHVREAYVFPLYAGLTIAKYAIVDAVDYTSEPVVDPVLSNAVDDYEARRKTVEPQTSLEWSEYSLIAFAISEDREDFKDAVMVVTNETGVNLTFLITTNVGDKGNLTSGWEWEETMLAVSTWERGDEVKLWMTVGPSTIPGIDALVMDIDWEGSSLVVR